MCAGLADRAVVWPLLSQEAGPPDLCGEARVSVVGPAGCPQAAPSLIACHPGPRPCLASAGPPPQSSRQRRVGEERDLRCQAFPRGKIWPGCSSVSCFLPRERFESLLFYV